MLTLSATTNSSPRLMFEQAHLYRGYLVVPIDNGDGTFDTWMLHETETTTGVAVTEEEAPSPICAIAVGLRLVDEAEQKLAEDRERDVKALCH